MYVSVVQARGISPPTGSLYDHCGSMGIYEIPNLLWEVHY